MNNIEMVKYDDEKFEFQILTIEDGQKVPLDSVVDEVIFSVRSYEGGEKVIKKKLSTFDIQYDPQTKKYSFWIYSADTENLELKDYICDIKRVIDGKEFTITDKFNLKLKYSVCGKADEDE